MLNNYKEETQKTIYDSDDYFFSHSDPLINLDYLSIAMLESKKEKLLKGDYMKCL